MTINRLVLHRLRVPLTTPYRLAFGPISAFDTLLVELRDARGRTGLGEATYLTGYSDETIDDGWTLAQRLADSYPEFASGAVKSWLQTHFATAPFTATAFNTALEMLAGNSLLAAEHSTRVPVLGLLHATATADIERGYFETFSAAAFVDLSPAYLRRLRARGEGPIFYRLGRRVVYRRSDLDEWVSRFKVAR